MLLDPTLRESFVERELRRVLRAGGACPHIGSKQFPFIRSGPSAFCKTEAPVPMPEGDTGHRRADGTADGVHGDGRRGASSRAGTGSNPLVPNGWQRAMRRTASQPPRNTPCPRNASIA